jgi:hypothetical protein
MGRGGNLKLWPLIQKRKKKQELEKERVQGGLPIILDHHPAEGSLLGSLAYGKFLFVVLCQTRSQPEAEGKMCVSIHMRLCIFFKLTLPDYYLKKSGKTGKVGILKLT